MFRRDDFAAAGGWRGDKPPVMDLDLWMRLLQYGEFLGLPETLAAFRIGRNTLSAADEGEIYRAQRALTDELGNSSLFQVRGIDLAVGRMLAPVGPGPPPRALRHVAQGREARGAGPPPPPPDHLRGRGPAVSSSCCHP